MNKNDLKIIRLMPEELTDKESMTAFMRLHLELPEWFGGNLDALSDVLGEVSQETVFEVDISRIGSFAKDGYQMKVLKVICRVCEDNPHVHVYLTDRD